MSAVQDPLDKSHRKMSAREHIQPRLHSDLCRLLVAQRPLHEETQAGYTRDQLRFFFCNL